MEKERVGERALFEQGGGGTHHSVSVKIWRQASKKEEKSFPFHKDVQLVIVFSVCEDLNKENWSVSKKKRNRLVNKFL